MSPSRVVLRAPIETVIVIATGVTVRLVRKRSLRNPARA